MNAKQRKVLETLVAEPIRTDIHYLDLEGLFAALGAEVYPNRRDHESRWC